MKSIRLLMTSLLFTSCATTTQSALLGAAVGGGIGAGVGQLESKNFRGTATGLLIGAGVGGLVGLLSHKDQEKRPADELPAAKPDEAEFPPLTKPKLRSMWVPDKIEGNKYIKGHFIYVIEDPGNWSID